MTQLVFTPLPTKKARELQSLGPDEHGQRPQRFISDGDGLPCRHCLDFIEEGEEVLLVSYKPFDTTQPFAEQGPIFLHAKECSPYSEPIKRPAMYEEDGDILLRAYDKHERIIYGTGQVIKNRDVEAVAAKLLEQTKAAFIHARSATNNCFQYRINRK